MNEISTERKSAYDAVIIGGGAAGLSAALILGRARRHVLVIDDGQPRNGVAEFSHGFTTRDGERPAELLRHARAELAVYPTIVLMNDSVINATAMGKSFAVTVASGATVVCTKLLLATGVFDELPDIDGLRDRWGKSIFVCPFCDGWEVRDKPVAVYGAGRDAVELAQEIYGWTKDLTVCIKRDDLTDNDHLWIKAAHVALKVGELEAISGSSEANVLTFEDDSETVCAALFLSAPLRQHSPLFKTLGCQVGDDGLIAVDAQSRTSVPGCYAAGDSVTVRHQVVIAAASGAAAAITLNCNLLEAEAAELTETIVDEYRADRCGL
jgi:thioredoxin reductase